MTTRETDRPLAGVFSSWMLRAMDADFTWQGLGRFRPTAKTQRMEPWTLAILALITSAPFVIIAGVLCIAVPMTPIIERSLLCIAIGGLLNLALQYWGAAAWNERAWRLTGRR